MYHGMIRTKKGDRVLNRVLMQPGSIYIKPQGSTGAFIRLHPPMLVMIPVPNCGLQGLFPSLAYIRSQCSCRLR